MARRRTETIDSFDLLLDTMCNAFGGIVMIAILVAILTREANREEERSKGTDPVIAMATTEAQKIEKDIEQIQSRNSEIEGELEGLSTIQELSDKHVAISSALAQAEEDVENLTRKIAEKEKEMDSDRSERMKEMNEEMAQAEKKAAEDQKEIADLEEQREKLARAIEKLEAQKKELMASQKRELRPPKMKETKRKALYFIVRYGEIFPKEKLTVDTGGEISNIDVQSPEFITWEGNLAKPQKGRGLKIQNDGEKIRDIFAAINRVNRKNASSPENQFYTVGVVYRDSYPAFVEFQKLIREMGIPHGWKPVAGENDFRFVTGGGESIKEE